MYGVATYPPCVVHALSEGMGFWKLLATSTRVTSMKRSLGMPHTHIHMTHRNLSHAYQVSQATPLQKENGLVTLQIVTSLASQIHFHKRGKGLVNCVYKLCSTILYSVVQSRCSILSHDTLHHCLSSNASFQNGDRELEYLFRYCRNCKNISTILLR